MTTAPRPRMESAASRATVIPAVSRLTPIDALRGIVMILMALDHVRDFFGAPGLSPTNLAAPQV